MKLSKTQTEVIKLMREGYTIYNFPCVLLLSRQMDASETMSRATLRVLVRNMLIRPGVVFNDSPITYTLTEKGKTIEI